MSRTPTSRQSCLFDCAHGNEPVLVSACLLGIPCRWHGRRPKRREELIRRLQKRYVLVPICPEQLGGMPTPIGIFGFTGHKQSFFGDLHVMGRDGFIFYTESKNVTSTWLTGTVAKKVSTWDGTITRSTG
jgi:uncharacterized protein YbbK (DUF523 family)